MAFIVTISDHRPDGVARRPDNTASNSCGPGTTDRTLSAPSERRVRACAANAASAGDDCLESPVSIVGVLVGLGIVVVGTGIAAGAGVSFAIFSAVALDTSLALGVGISVTLLGVMRQPARPD